MDYKFREPTDYTGNDVKRIRKEAGMTQKELAQFIGVSKKTVEAWEYGKNPPGGPIKRLLEILQRGDMDTLPFAFDKNAYSRVKYVEMAAVESYGNGEHWMRYLRKFVDNDDPKLTRKQVKELMASSNLSMFQKVSLKRAIEKGTTTNKHVIGLNKPAKLKMISELREKNEYRKREEGLRASEQGAIEEKDHA